MIRSRAEAPLGQLRREYIPSNVVAEAEIIDASRSNTQRQTGRANSPVEATRGHLCGTFASTHLGAAPNISPQICERSTAGVVARQFPVEVIAAQLDGAAIPRAWSQRSPLDRSRRMPLPASITRGARSEKREEPVMRRLFADYDFVDFVTFMLAATGLVVWLYMETGLV